jgi:mono/diheme cytochrome c family protein
MRTSFFALSIFFLALAAINAAPPYYYNQAVVKKDVVVVKEKVVEFDADTYLGLGGYYAVVDELADKHSLDKRLDKKDEQIGQLISQVDILLKKLEGKYNPGDVKPVEPVPTVIPEPSSPPSEPAPVPTNDNLDAQVFKIFKDNCIDCHGPAQSKGKLKLIDRDDKGNFLVNNSKIAHRIYDRVQGFKLRERGLQLMPIGGHQIEDNDLQTLWVWTVRELDKVTK